jgi:membrane protease YdiL (CAAX protease family)
MNRRLRALGRLLVFALLALVIFPAKRRWLYAALHGTDETLGYLLDHTIELAAILIFCSVAARLEHRPFGAYGLPRPPAFRARFWQGAVAGLVSLSVLVLALRAAGAIHVGPPSTSALVAAGFGLAYAVVFVVLAVREEFLYRGYGQLTLTEAAGFWPAAVVTSAWFAATHAGPNESAIGLANAAIFGLLACLTLRWTGSLWLAVGFHASWDWGETYFYGVADSGHAAAPGHLLTATVSPGAPTWMSGGRVGPEGSLLCVALLGLLAILCARLLRGGRGPAATVQPLPVIPAPRPPAGG